MPSHPKLPPSDRGGSCRRLGRDLVAHSSCWSPFEKSLSHDSRRDGDAVRCEAGPTAPQPSNRSPTTPKVQINEDEDVTSFRRACFDSGWNKSSSFLDSSSGSLSSPSSLSETEFPKSTRKSSTSLRTSCLSSSRLKSVSNVYPPPLYITPRFPKLYFQSNEFTIANSEYNLHQYNAINSKTTTDCDVLARKTSKNDITCIGAPHMRLQFIQTVINIPGTREFDEVEIRRREDIREYEEDETANLASPTSSTLCSPTGSANLPLNHRLNTPSRGRSRPRWRRHAHV
nr:hypothetical protein Iba_chr08aCG13410 [Ipomoea batatas]